jgi:hypothetical protein
MRKASVEDKRASADEKRSMAELIAEENKIMMMDPSNIDVYTREWWDYARMEILQRRREVALVRGAAEASARRTTRSIGPPSQGV